MLDHHVIFRVDFDNSKYKSKGQRKQTNEDDDDIDRPLELDNVHQNLFLNVFPCSIGFDEEYKIKHVGDMFVNLFDPLIDSDLFRAFNITRPNITGLDWNKVDFFNITYNNKNYSNSLK